MLKYFDEFVIKFNLFADTLNFPEILAVCFFWITFIMPGYALYVFLLKRSLIGNKQLNNKDIITSFVYSFFLSNLLLLPFNVLAYFISVPVIIISLSWIAAVLLSVYYLWKNRVLAKEPLKNIDFKSKTILVILGILVFDFIVSLLMKANLHFGSDTWVHLSKINHSFVNGFNSLDPYFIQPGQNIPFSAHASNILHTILLLPSAIFKVPVFAVIAYSLFFYKLFIFSTTYLLIRRFTGNKDLSVFLILIYYATHVFTLEKICVYPAFFAVALCYVGLNFLFDIKEEKFLSSKINYLLYISGIILISFAHQIQFLIFALFVGIYGAYLFLSKKLGFKKLVLLVSPLVLGLPTSIYTYLQSTAMPQSVFNFANESFYNFGAGLYAMKFPYGIIDGIFMALSVYLAFIYIKDNMRRDLLFYSVVFSWVFFYTPAFTLLNKFIPAWGIYRIDYLVLDMKNILFMLIFWFAAEKIIKNKKAPQLFPFSVVFLAILLLNQGTINDFYKIIEGNQGTFLRARQIQEILKDTKKGETIMTSEWLGLAAPALKNVYVAGLNDSRTTDSIDTKEREADMNGFMNFTVSNEKRQEIIKQYGFNKVLVDKYPKEASETANLESLGFSKTKETEYYYLFELKQ